MRHRVCSLSVDTTRSQRSGVRRVFMIHHQDPAFGGSWGLLDPHDTGSYETNGITSDEGRFPAKLKTELED